jgi:hypothetical protein
MEVFAIVVLVLGLIGASMVRRHLIQAKQLRLREIIHEERVKAMEHSVELPEANDAQLVALLGEVGVHGPNGSGWLPKSILWARLVALCLGLAAFLGGVGTCIGMALTSGDEMSEFWAMGLIPAFIGVGLLIFYVLSATLMRQAREQSQENAR